MINTEKNENAFLEFDKAPINRRSLLVWWIKVFCWIFMFLGAATIGILGLAFFNITISLSIYGLEANEPFSLYGLMIILVALYKGYVAYALWFEKDNAVYLGQIDAIIGILICLASMFILPVLEEGVSFTFRLELLFLIPYLLRLLNIRKKWELGVSN